MAQVITNADINNPNQQNQNPNQVSTNSSNQQPSQNQSSSNAQIAQNYSGSPQAGQQGQGPAGGASPAANPNSQKGTGFTNIQRIVQANQNNRLGSTIGQGIQNAGQQSQQATQNAQQQFQQQSAANQANTGANAQLVQNALSNPTSVTGNPNQVSQFQNLMSGTYQGPMGLANAGQLQAQAQDVGQLGQATNSAGGQQGLLQRFVGNPQYNAGQQKMDSLLLGATGGKDLAAARQATAGVQSREQQAQTGAQQQAQQNALQTQQFGQSIQQQFGQDVSKQQQGLQQQAQTAQQARDAKVAALQQQVGQGNLTQDIANQLGVKAGDYNYGVDPSKYLSESAQQATAQNAANSQQYAQMQALAQLGGQQGPAAAQQTLAQYNNPSQAGTFQAAKGYDVNAPAFQNAQQQGQQAYQNYEAGTVNPINQQLQSAVAAAYQKAAFGGGAQSIFGDTSNHAVDWSGVNPIKTQLAAAQAQAAQDLGQQFNIAPDNTSGS